MSIDPGGRADVVFWSASQRRYRRIALFVTSEFIIYVSLGIGAQLVYQSVCAYLPQRHHQQQLSASEGGSGSQLVDEVMFLP